ncbi:Mth938-like domain-containing protein [Methylotenera sp.]|uniref:Mth938-like domain-containing protein n=1 Tax=Methylotenera sp. TaxID=2051956 RepID=UPI0024883225|nr:Mth938-like domain-containing protein [Methylotenera sp.]MDI1361458.1 Mth938-like domain-containing protein [Methylotenera sp.]
MKLHLTNSDGNYLITGYGQGWVDINRQRYSNNLILLPNQLIENWHVLSFDNIQANDFEKIVELKPDVVLLGTGASHKFIHPKLTTALTRVGISLESMSTDAACRTYNILMSEGRNVLAALIL